MGRCVICDIETNEKVNDNIGGKSYLCHSCQCKFERCDLCCELCLGEELSENGICDYCNDGN